MQRAGRLPGRSGASRFGGIEGLPASHGRDGPYADPLEQAKRAAPMARRREGLEPKGCDDKGGTGRSPQSPVVRSTGPPCMYLDRLKPLFGAQA